MLTFVLSCTRDACLPRRCAKAMRAAANKRASHSTAHIACLMLLHDVRAGALESM